MSTKLARFQDTGKTLSLMQELKQAVTLLTILSVTFFHSIALKPSGLGAVLQTSLSLRNLKVSPESMFQRSFHWKYPIRGGGSRAGQPLGNNLEIKQSNTLNSSVSLKLGVDCLSRFITIR
ncbi:unnamed protein product [Lasius platythorax]|uniref:Uncharacterized protein n=1 Tax=Lasius platythorax TaxID=488582 RepID=A0AAV2MZ46_9HYME